MLTAYNVVGKPEKITDKEGNETKISYDPAGNISEEVSPSGTVS
ncbi:YD repeat (two copies), partial [Lachnospiraceae bacterium A4]